MKLSRIAMTGAAGVMGLGLIGVGAHAAFTANTTSHQSVNAGTLSMVFTDPGVTGTGTTSVTVSPLANQGTSFTTTTVKLTVKNAGSLTAYNILSTIGVSNGGGGPTGALENESYVCLVFTGGGTPWVAYDGPLAGAPHSQSVSGTEKAGTSAWYVMNVYAGTEHTACGSAAAGSAAPAGGGTSTAPSLTNNAEGGTITVTETLSYSAKP